MKATIHFFPHDRKKNPATGKIPMYARVILNRKKAEIRLSADITIEERSQWVAATMRFMDRSFYVNKMITRLELKFYDYLSDHVTKLPQSSPKDICDFILGKKVESNSVTAIAYIEQYYKETILPNSTITLGTKKNYRKAANHFITFLELNKSKHILVSELDNTIALRFKDYLLGCFPGANRKGLTEPSAAGNIKKFRTIFDRAVLEKQLDKNPFKILKLKTRSPERDRLNSTQVQQLYNINLQSNPSLEVYRDIFLFSVYTGLAYKDAINLKYKDLTKVTERDIRLTLKREKTAEKVDMFLVQQALDIIEKYRSHPENIGTTFVLPRRSLVRINMNLKFLAELINIPFKLTSHIGRHTARMLLAEAGIIERAVIKSFMGHSNQKDIDSTYFIVTTKHLVQAKNLFENFLTEELNLCSK